MILYLIIQGFSSIISFVISLFPVLETPAYLVNNFPAMLNMIIGFNYYLPVSEAFTCALLVIGFSIVFRVFSVIGGLVHLNI